MCVTCKCLHKCTHSVCGRSGTKHLHYRLPIPTLALNVPQQLTTVVAMGLIQGSMYAITVVCGKPIHKVHYGGEVEVAKS